MPVNLSNGGAFVAGSSKMSDRNVPPEDARPGKLTVSVRRLKMADIAQIANVSVSTVSRALAGSPLIPQTMRDKIAAIARAHGYVVNQAARALRLQTTGTIGIVLPVNSGSSRPVTDPFVLEMIGQLTELVTARRFDVLLSKIPAPHPGWLSDLIQSNRFDGMIMLGQSDQHAALDDIAGHYFPLVVWGQRLPGQRYCTVGVDNRLGGELATRHLIENGRHAIQFLGPSGVPEVDARYQGYIDAHKAAGMTPRAPLEAHFSHEAGRRAMSDLLISGAPFDAIFAASDVIAHGAKTMFLDAGGTVPATCAFVGFDDVAMARYLSPPLTTIRQPLTLAAQTLVDLLFERLDGKSTHAVVLAPELIVRQSSQL